MTTIAVRESVRSLEAWSWLGLAAGLAAVLTAAAGPRPVLIGYAAMSPQDLTAWVTAICSAVAAIAAAANAVAIVAHRWRNRFRGKPRKRKARSDARQSDPEGP